MEGTSLPPPPPPPPVAGVVAMYRLPPPPPPRVAAWQETAIRSTAPASLVLYLVTTKAAQDECVGAGAITRAAVCPGYEYIGFREREEDVRIALF